jgi:hypothetical protein
VNKALKYGAVLIGGYLIVAHYTGFGKAITATGGQAVSLTKALQGR